MKPTTARVLERLSDGAWHSAIDLIDGCFQSSGDRRMRELRAMRDADGQPVYPIERRRIRLASGKASHAYEYRLTVRPTEAQAAAEQTQAALPLTMTRDPLAHWPP